MCQAEVVPTVESLLPIDSCSLVHKSAVDWPQSERVDDVIHHVPTPVPIMWSVAVLLALVACSVSAGSGGISGTVSQQGIDYLLEAIKPMVTKELDKTKIPTVIGKVRHDRFDGPACQ